MSILYSYHPGWIALAGLLALGYAFGLYYKDKLLAELKGWLKLTLAIFRFLTVFIIGLLLVGLILESFKSETEKPLLFIAQDDTESIVQTKDSTFYKTTYLDQVQAFNNAVGKKFDVIHYQFSDEVTNSPQTSYTGKVTDISQVLNQIYDQYNNRNIGAIILSTDGVYNQGANPVYTIARKPNVPVFTIGLGDTTRLNDLLIKDVIHNEIAFLGNQFPVEVNLNHEGFKGETVQVDISDGKQTVFSKKVDLGDGTGSVQVRTNLKALNTGFRKYMVSVSELKGELTYKNNSQNFYINVVDGRQKILLTYSGIHPDISALNYVIEKNKNYELTVSSIESLKGNLNQYDLIIVHNYQAENKALSELIQTNVRPVLFIVGVNSDLKSLEKANIGLSGQANNFEDVSFVANTRFNEIIYPNDLFKVFEDAPPLRAPLGNIEFSPSLKILAYQKIGAIALSKPLIYFNEKGDTKYGVIFGEGIWRWRLFDQAKTQSTSNFETLISKMINYLAIKENKDPFKVELDNEYDESEKISIRASLYNASYDLINTPDVTFELVAENDSTKLDYHFYKTTEAYKLDLGRLKEGVYRWKANTSLNGNGYEKSGVFLVRAVKRELLNLTANHRILNHISTETNGGFFKPTDLGQLEETLMNRSDIVSITYQEKAFDDLIDYKWLFILLIILLSVEWFVRKYQGGY